MAEAIARAVDGAVAGGRVYELGGPEIRTLREIVDFVFEVTERRRAIVPLPNAVRRGPGQRARHARPADPRPDAGRIRHHPRPGDPAGKPTTWSPRRRIAEGRTLAGLGIAPTTIEAIVPSYLMRFRKTGQFDLKRNAGQRRRAAGAARAPRNRTIRSGLQAGNSLS